MRERYTEGVSVCEREGVCERKIGRMSEGERCGGCTGVRERKIHGGCK